MLKQLTIKNYTLIKDLTLDLSDHMNVVTGETGAGKSILLGAMGLLLGNRADVKSLWVHDEKCIIEGVFKVDTYPIKPIFENLEIDYEPTTIMRREISPGGKSRTFINDTPVTLETMRQIGSQLMDIHSQHDTLQISNRIFQLRLIDHYGETKKLQESYTLTWKKYQQIKKNVESLRNEINNIKTEHDLINFQLSELDQAQLQENEIEELENESKILENAETIKNNLKLIIEHLGGQLSESSMTHTLSSIRSLLLPIHQYTTSYKDLFNRLEGIRLELDDIQTETEHLEQQVEYDPSRLETTKQRLSQLYRLFQKHKVKTIDELLLIKKDLTHRIEQSDLLNEQLKADEKTLGSIEKELIQSAEMLSTQRKQACPLLCKELLPLLAKLGIPKATFDIQHTATTPGPNGKDQMEMIFSANTGIPPRPLGEVASGGEFSRLMFCLKYIMAKKSVLPTLVLDEIDIGISGEIALQMGRIMQEMAKNHQLLIITHLPQIASKGDCHYYVFKHTENSQTTSLIRKLSDPERLHEIASMIGGAKPSSLALENARELINR